MGVFRIWLSEQYTIGALEQQTVFFTRSALYISPIVASLLCLNKSKQTIWGLMQGHLVAGH